MSKIAIIGAGWMGIGCLRILKEYGHTIDVFELLDDIGGVWHPVNAYTGLLIHTPARDIEYFDYPLPDWIDRSDRVSAEQVQDYLKSYCHAKDLYAHMQFNTEISQINYEPVTKKTAIFCSQFGEMKKLEGYDFVVYTEGFTRKKIPDFPGIENFKGKILHSFDIKKNILIDLIKQKKKITVIGGSKSATDMIMNLDKFNYPAQWVYEKNFWFARFNFYQKIIRKNIQKKRYCFDIHALIFVSGLMLSEINPKLTYWLWRWFNLIDTYGDRHYEFNKFHLSWLSDDELKALKKFNQNYGMPGQIDYVDEKHLYLKGGQKIENDVIICCTGSACTPPKVKIYCGQEKLNFESLNQIYRGMIIPKLPNLIITAFCFFGMGTVNALNHGKWIQKYIEAEFSQDYLEKNAYTYDYPFFNLHFLFDSKGVLFKRNALLMNQFLKSKELSYFQYIKNTLAMFLNYKGCKPVEFNFPKNI